MDKKLENVDFAWVGVDRKNRLALFYGSISNSPDDVKSIYELDSYNDVTDFIIDELPKIGGAIAQENSVKVDAEKGFYVYLLQDNSGYKRVAAPEKNIYISALKDYSRLLIDMTDRDFFVDKVIQN